MNNKRHKSFTILFGAILFVSLLANLIQMSIQTPRSFIDMFKLTKEVELPWIPYLSLSVILLSSLGAIGLMKYRKWGFYSMYVSYLAGAVVVWFPFFPSFILQFASGMFASVLTLFGVVGILVALIYFHVSGQRQGYFSNSVEA